MPPRFAVLSMSPAPALGRGTVTGKEKARDKAAGPDPTGAPPPPGGQLPARTHPQNKLRSLRETEGPHASPIATWPRGRAGRPGAGAVPPLCLPCSTARGSLPGSPDTRGRRPFPFQPAAPFPEHTCRGPHRRAHTHGAAQRNSICLCISRVCADKGEGLKRATEVQQGLRAQRGSAQLPWPLRAQAPASDGLWF